MRAFAYLPDLGHTIDHVLLRYKYLLYPNRVQQEALARTFGCVRVVYNDGLRMRRKAYEKGQPYLDDNELQKRVITEAKRIIRSAAPASHSG